VLDLEFAEPDHPPLRHTKPAVVVHDGRVVAERYGPGFGIDTPILGNSLTKAVTNPLVGILVREGRLAVEKAAPVAAWGDPGDPRHEITLDQLLRMRSGLDLGNSLDATPSSLCNPSNRMLFLESDMAKFAECAALDARPGTLWNYSDGNYLIVSRVIRDTVGGHGRCARFRAPRALRSLGDAPGHARIRCDRDTSRIGFHAGLGTRLGALGPALSRRRRSCRKAEGCVGYSSRPIPNARVGYGAGFWTNLDTSYGAENRVGLGMPRDAYFGRGKFGQYIIVVPSARLVVVRLGVTHGWEDIDGVSRLTANVIGALDRHSAGMSSRDPAPPTRRRQ
jgi:CubicO group peptidase (beta-lactamase class C family)